MYILEITYCGSITKYNKRRVRFFQKIYTNFIEGNCKFLKHYMRLKLEEQMVKQLE